jgi:hypothetical protein
MHVEFTVWDELRRTFEFRLKILYKNFGRCNDLVILDLRINDKSLDNLWDFCLKILFLNLLDFVQSYPRFFIPAKLCLFYLFLVFAVTFIADHLPVIFVQLGYQLFLWSQAFIRTKFLMLIVINQFLEDLLVKFILD